MTNKLTKKAKNEIKKEINAEWEILQKVNVSNPTEADKQAYYNLKKEKPGIFDGMTTLVQGNRDFILNQHCSFLAAEKTKNELKKMRDALGWETGGEIERLLIEQICINHLRVTLLEKHHALKTVESHTTETGLYWEKRLDSAHRRYMRTVETFAKVKKYLAEANLRDAQARGKRAKATNAAADLLKKLTSGT